MHKHNRANFFPKNLNGQNEVLVKDSHDYFDRMRKAFKKIRKEKNFTHKDIEEMTGLSANYISLIETGKKNPKIDTYFKLCDALEVEAGAFFVYAHCSETQCENVSIEELTKDLKLLIEKY